MMGQTFSIVRGQVTDNKDPDLLGRVKVRFPFLGGKAKDNESPWCRVARSLSQSGAGDWFLPDEGDEVLVAFENNDRSRPIVIGSLFTEERKPPQTGRAGDANKDGKNTLRAIQTKAGHKLIFDDSHGQELISIIDKAQGQVTLDSAHKKITLKDPHGNTVLMDQEGIKIETAKGDSLQIKDSGITIQSAQSVTIAGSSKIELGQGAAKSLVLGEDLLQAFNNHTHIYSATTTMGTTNPPMTPMTAEILSKKVKTV